MKNRIMVFSLIIAMFFLSGCTTKKELNCDYSFFGIVKAIEDGNTIQVEFNTVKGYGLNNYGTYYNHIYDDKEGFILDEDMLENTKSITFDSKKFDVELAVGDLVQVNYHNSQIIGVKKSDKELIKRTKEDVNTITEVYKYSKKRTSEDTDITYYSIFFENSNDSIEIAADKSSNCLSLITDIYYIDATLDLDKFYIYIIDLDKNDNSEEILVTDGKYENYIFYFWNYYTYCAKVNGKLYAEGDGILKVENSFFEKNFSIVTSIGSKLGYWYGDDDIEYVEMYDEPEYVPYYEEYYNAINLNEGHSEKTLIFSFKQNEGFALEGDLNGSR